MMVVTSTRINHGRGGLVAGQSSAAAPHNDRSCSEACASNVQDVMSTSPFSFE